MSLSRGRSRTLDGAGHSCHPGLGVAKDGLAAKDAAHARRVSRATVDSPRGPRGRSRGRMPTRHGTLVRNQPRPSAPSGRSAAGRLALPDPARHELSIRARRAVTSASPETPSEPSGTRPTTQRGPGPGKRRTWRRRARAPSGDGPSLYAGCRLPIRLRRPGGECGAPDRPRARSASARPDAFAAHLAPWSRQVNADDLQLGSCVAHGLAPLQARSQAPMPPLAHARRERR